ncbi:MAG: threonine/serine exporter family protein [Clostridia bacterium]|nr:threonine/serine exporter family protein [Clostridia bacterium]
MKEQLNCAMDIGEQLLLCGAEVHRVEDSVRRICSAFGATHTDVFIITSSMVVTVRFDDGESLTQTRRLTNGGTDFEKVHQLNALSRRICAGGLSVEETQAELQRIMQIKTYPFWLECVSYALIAGAFTLFFGGGWIEAAISLCIGAVVRLVILASDRTVANKMFAKFIASFASTALSFLALHLGLVATVDNLIIGNIMTLVPGIGLTNALRDLFTGDSIAGLLRSIEAVLIALAIAAGYFLFVFVGGVVG